MAGAGSDAARAVYAQLATTTPASGWCSILGKAAGSPLAAGDAERVGGHVAAALLNDPVLRMWLLNPLTSALTTWRIAETRQAVISAVNALVARGATCDGVPNDLRALPGVEQPDTFGEVAGNVISAVIDFTGLGPILVKAAVLVGIIVLLLMAIRRVLS